MFENDSIMSGVLEFETPNGRMRAMSEDGNWGVFLHRRGLFIRDATVSKKRGDTPRSIYQRWREIPPWEAE